MAGSCAWNIEQSGFGGHDKSVLAHDQYTD